MIELHYFNNGALLVKATDENEHEYQILLTHTEARQLHQELSQDFISPDHYYDTDDTIESRIPEKSSTLTNSSSTTNHH